MQPQSHHSLGWVLDTNPFDIAGFRETPAGTRPRRPLRSWTHIAGEIITIRSGIAFQPLEAPGVWEYVALLLPDMASGAVDASRVIEREALHPGAFERVAWTWPAGRLHVDGLRYGVRVRMNDAQRLSEPARSNPNCAAMAMDCLPFGASFTPERTG